MTEDIARLIRMFSPAEQALWTHRGYPVDESVRRAWERRAYVAATSAPTLVFTPHKKTAAEVAYRKRYDAKRRQARRIRAIRRRIAQQRAGVAA